MRIKKPCIKPEHALKFVVADETNKACREIVQKQIVPPRKQEQQLVIASSRANPDVMSMDAAYWFLVTHALPAQHMEACYGYLDFLQSLFVKAPNESSLVHAVTACAVFLQEAWSDLYPDSVRMRRHLSQALRSVNEALADPEESLKDETLVAVLLLDLHDSFSNMVQTRSPTGTHFTDGVMALIHHRGPRNYDTEIARRLSNAVRHQVLKHANEKGLPINEATKIWAEADNVTANLPRNKATDLDLLSLKLNGLKMRMLSFAAEQSPSSSVSLPAELYDLFKDIEMLDFNLRQWYDTIPESWQPLRIESRVDFFGTYQGVYDVYYDISVARVINDYRLSRATVLTWLILLTSMGGGFWVQKGLQVRAKFQALIDDFCASVPFHLGNRFSTGDFDDTSFFYPGWPDDGERNRRNTIQATALGGTLLLGGLRGILDLVSSCPVFDPPLLRAGQQEWLQSQLLRIAVMYNFRLPLNGFDNSMPPLVADLVGSSEVERQSITEMIGMGWNFKL